jgi:hypothetical protein
MARARPSSGEGGASKGGAHLFIVIPAKAGIQGA